MTDVRLENDGDRDDGWRDHRCSFRKHSRRFVSFAVNSSAPLHFARDDKKFEFITKKPCGRCMAENCLSGSGPPYGGITRIRFKGSVAAATLSANGSPALLSLYIYRYGRMTKRQSAR